MPKYHARNIEISLVATSLNDSTTQTPTAKRSSQVTETREAGRCENAFKRSGIRLAETPIPCHDGDLKSNLHILGDDLNPFPMYLVHVSQDIEKSIKLEETLQLSTRHHDVSANYTISSQAAGRDIGTKPEDTHNTTSFPGTSKIRSTDIYALAIKIGFCRRAIQLSAKREAAKKAGKSTIPAVDLRYDGQ
jgi:hypothetical protein